VLDHGRIVEQGDHASLLARGGYYAGLYTMSFAAVGGRNGRLLEEVMPSGGGLVPHGDAV
ncbi:MAG: hypothetical protein AAB289_09000, partial [Chloroflexota bacterium]